MTLIYSLLGQLLKLIYDLVGHYGWSIVIFTIAIKLFMLPLMNSQMKSMKAMQVIQPKIEEIKKKYPGNQEKQNQLTMELYREHNVNPFMGCLPMLIQLPILFGLFAVLRDPVKYVFQTQSAFELADTGFFWISSMTLPDVISVGGIVIPFILPIIAAITTYIDSSMMQKGQEKNQTMVTMTYVMPVIILWYGRTFPSGLSLYWAVSNIFSIVQKFVLKPKEVEDVAGKKGSKR